MDPTPLLITVSKQTRKLNWFGGRIKRYKGEYPYILKFTPKLTHLVGITDTFHDYEQRHNAIEE